MEALAALRHPDQHDTDGNRTKTQQAPGLGRDIRDCLNKLFQPVGQKGKDQALEDEDQAKAEEDDLHQLSLLSDQTCRRRRGIRRIRYRA